jgi:hypothetical protein
MFDWLEKEIVTIKTPGFHIVEDPDVGRTERVRGLVGFVLPADYEGFIARFGNARLYRRSKNASYRIGVFSEPRKLAAIGLESIYEIGFNQGAIVAAEFAPDSNNSSILEAESSNFRVVSKSFSEWLEDSCSKIKCAFGNEKWAEIVKGPPPFSQKELAILSARRLFHWKRVTTNREGDIIINVYNESDRVLTLLTIGVRSRDGRLNGAIRIPIRELKPGESADFAVNCYKDLVTADEVELFSLPEPHPADRDRFPELED